MTNTNDNTNKIENVQINSFLILIFSFSFNIRKKIPDGFIRESIYKKFGSRILKYNLVGWKIYVPMK